VSPAWTLVLAKALVSYKETSPTEFEAELPRAWKSVWDFLESTDRDTRKSAAEALDLISTCFNSSLIEKALSDARQGSDSSIVVKIVTQIQKALDSLTFARSIPELLSVISSLVRALRYRGGVMTNPTAAEVLMPGVVKKIGILRTQKNFEYKEDADKTLGVVMGVIGPEALLEILPLNLEPSDRYHVRFLHVRLFLTFPHRVEGREPRAFLLPLLTQPHPSPLNHFISYFVPLTERMFDYQQTAEAEGRASEAKVWSVLVSQIWIGLPGYCHGTVDLKLV
jgi:ribosomal RNA-processing protein 12